MWAKLVVSVTLLPMLVHSILGCCWHHAHSEWSFSFVSSPIEARDCDGHRHNHPRVHSQCSDCTRSDVPLPCQHDKPCDDFQCVYVEAGFVRVAFEFDRYDQVAASNINGTLFRSVAATNRRNPHQTRKVSASLHHCALTQVWVI